MGQTNTVPTHTQYYYDQQFKKQLFYSYNKCQKKQKCPIGVLVGFVGQGKSTLFNKITNKNTAISNNLKSTTRNAFSSYSSYGESFKILDTPGLQSENDKVKHCLAVREALIEGPINRIFLLIKCEKVGLMIKNIQEYLFTFQEWVNIITIVITHWDKDDTDENRSTFEETKITILENSPELQNSFIFVGQDSDPSQLCEAIYRSLCQNDPVKIEIDLKKFKYKFNIYNNMKTKVMKQQEVLKNVEQDIINSIINYKHNDKDEFLHACIVNISQIAEEIIEDFTKQYGKDMDEIQNYMYYLELKSLSIPVVENIRKIASQSMSYNLLNPKDPRNLFKQCPHCGQIWLKVEGCEGMTFCGSRFYGKDVYLNEQQFMKYKYDWKKYKWIIQKKNKSSNLDEYREGNSGIGCGKALEWRQAPIISMNIIQQLKDAGISDIMVDYKEDQYQSINQTLLSESEKAVVHQLS